MLKDFRKTWNVFSLHWCHNDHDGVSNHQPHGCLLSCLFRRRSKKTSKLRVTGLCEGNSPAPVNSPHKGPVTRKMFPFDDVIMLSISRHWDHAVSANRILWVYAGFWWYHGILLVHLQDSVGAFGAKWLTKWLHHAKAPPHRGVLLWEWGNKDVHLVTTFVFCHVSKCYFFQQEFHCENVSAECRSLVQVTPIELDFEVIFM